jgi:hypothetical protein
MIALEHDKLSPTTIKLKCPPFLATILCRYTEETLDEFGDERHVALSVAET